MPFFWDFTFIENRFLSFILVQTDKKYNNEWQLFLLEAILLGISSKFTVLI